MKFSIIFLFLTLVLSVSFSQEKKGKLFFEAGLNYGNIYFKPLAENDDHFQTYIDEFKHLGNLNLGIGWFFKNNITLGLKTGISIYSWNSSHYNQKFEESFIDTFVYVSSKDESSVNLGTGGELLMSAEIGYLLKFNKITLKPNFEIGFLGGQMAETSYALRASNENLPTFIKSMPSNVKSIYLGGSIDLGIPRLERFFLHLGYGYSPYDVRVEIQKTTPEGIWTSTTQKNKFQSQRVVLGLKFALLKR